MLYIQQSLGPDEELVHVGQFHWIYTLTAVMSIVWGVIGCIAVIWGGIYLQAQFMDGFYAEGVLGKSASCIPGCVFLPFSCF